MIAVLLPVKTFARSKNRMAGFLTPSERVLLARTMFDDVWDALREAQRMCGFDRLLVVSAEPYVLARCREQGITYLEENEQLSHTDSVNRATDWAMSLGADSLLSVPIDTPAVTAAEILAVLELRRSYPVVIVPSSDSSGTNALLRTPPDAIHAHFGPGSCLLHAQEAEAKGHTYLVFPSPGFARDIDTPDDLQTFAAADFVSPKSEMNERPCRTTQLARQFLAARRGEPVCR